MSENPVAAVGSWLIKYLALILLGASVVATGVSAQFQINENSKDIAANTVSISNRVPIFLHEADIKRVEAELKDLSESVDENEGLVQQVDRNSDKIESKIELEIERLRNMIRQSDSVTTAKLETILRLLEQELNLR